MSAGVVTVAPATAVLDAVPGAWDLLTEAERLRAARLRPGAHRRAFVAAHVLVRLCAGHVFGLPLTTPLEQRCPTCCGPHGPAQLLERPQAGVSLAHAADVVAAAVAPTPVGVDVEPVASAPGVVSVAHAIVSPAEARPMAGRPHGEQAALLLWVRKEALVKLGLITLDAMSDLDLSSLPSVPPQRGRHRRLRWDRYAIIDLSLEVPAAVGAAVSESELEVVPLDLLDT